MCKYNISKIIGLSKFIHDKIKEMDNDIPYIKRERKTTIFDGILYRLYYSQLGARYIASQYNSPNSNIKFSILYWC